MNGSAWIKRVTKARRRKIALGGYASGPCPFGYTTAGPPGRVVLVPDPTEAPVLRLIFKLYTTTRWGLEWVAKTLVQRGHMTRNGRPWSRAGLSYILQNPVYAGRLQGSRLVPDIHWNKANKKLHDVSRLRGPRRAKAEARQLAKTGGRK